MKVLEILNPENYNVVCYCIIIKTTKKRVQYLEHPLINVVNWRCTALSHVVI